MTARVERSSIHLAGIVCSVTNHNETILRFTKITNDCLTTQSADEQWIARKNDENVYAVRSDGLSVIYYFHYLYDGGGSDITRADVIIVWRRQVRGTVGKIRLGAPVRSAAERCATLTVVPGTLTFLAAAAAVGQTQKSKPVCSLRT